MLRSGVPVLLAATLGLGACASTPPPPEVSRDAQGRVAPADWRGTLEETLRADVSALANRYPSRHLGNPGRLNAAAAWLESRLTDMGYTPRRQSFDITHHTGRSATLHNIIAEAPAAAPDAPWLVIGAHYDSVPGTPGADDNASGVAGVLALASWFHGRPLPVHLRFELYTNEESLLDAPDQVGSLRSARAAASSQMPVAAALILEMIGAYNEDPLSPDAHAFATAAGLTPPADNTFLAVAAWDFDAPLVRRVVDAWEGPVSALAVVTPAGEPMVARSDHWSWWQVGVPALMITDTAELRNPNYHGPRDTPATLDYPRMAHAVETIREVIVALAADPPAPRPLLRHRVTLTNSGETPLRVIAGPDDAPVTIAPGARTEVFTWGYHGVELVDLAAFNIGIADVHIHGRTKHPIDVTWRDHTRRSQITRGATMYLPRQDDLTLHIGAVKVEVTEDGSRE